MQGGRTVRPEVEGDGFDVSCLSVARRAAPWHIWIVITRVVVHKLEAIAPPHITTRPGVVGGGQLCDSKVGMVEGSRALFMVATINSCCRAEVCDIVACCLLHKQQAQHCCGNQKK